VLIAPEVGCALYDNLELLIVTEAAERLELFAILVDRTKMTEKIATKTNSTKNTDLLLYIKVSIFFQILNLIMK
jgi:hypothetical protein